MYIVYRFCINCLSFSYKSNFLHASEEKKFASWRRYRATSLWIKRNRVHEYFYKVLCIIKLRGKSNCVKIMSWKFCLLDIIPRNSWQIHCRAHRSSFNIAFCALAYVSAFILRAQRTSSLSWNVTEINFKPQSEMR